MNLGPGSYIKDKSKNVDGSKEIKAKEFYFGTDQRFKMAEDLKELPGPGNYKDANKWNKRTFNLKFLNK